MRLKGSEIILECLIHEGVTVMFGYPGGAILPTYDAMSKYMDRLHHVLVRHEQGASHMADGYARATGNVGVCIATSGPGATNLITGLATAMMDSSPVVAITGQVAVPTIGTDAFQETDVTGATLPVTKHNYLVTDVEELAYTIKEAFYIARTGRPGPVLIDVPKDVQNAETEFDYDALEPVHLPGYRLLSGASEDQIDQMLDLIHEAERPVILAGHGITMSGANAELQDLAELAQIPVAQTLLGKGSMPQSHPLVVGWMGMHGDAASNNAIQEADLLIALGMRFDDRVTGNLKSYSPHSRKIHIDIDPSELNKNVVVDVPVAGDLKTVLRQVLPRLERRTHAEWLNRIRDWQEDSSERDILNHDTQGKLMAAQVINDLWRYTDGNAITVSDVGQHQMLEAQYYPHQRPSTMLTSGGLGTMGFGFPASIGAKFGKPDEEVWAIVGDGGFQMTLCELATARQENINVNIAIINNSFLGMVRQWQELFYERRYQSTPMFSPDFCKLAEAYGIPSMRVTSRDQIQESVDFARSVDGPVLIEYVVEKEDIVYPMVPSGADLHDMKRRPKPGELA
ncbi:biosynthetic-type acetolactate synthase large subunit [Phototrophicus methaneseepsis]|uniref:Acetolactate synthase n=1 Tax=Phototrophicus methaneseepsis TaxID=2710758 RepID=A0A7S8IDN8_9CHLR|nr:biosynthetic-type acetolactate synthase large subunit [Phototrophicus methaneseepsis]QPC80998.1 biosynthetic-type acetolactate synthase large subunit [Phototrophicus methaneseepsis]